MKKALLVLLALVLSAGAAHAAVLGSWSYTMSHKDSGTASDYPSTGNYAQRVYETDMYLTAGLVFGSLTSPVATLAAGPITGDGTYTFNASNVGNWANLVAFLTNGVDEQVYTQSGWYHGNNNPYRNYGDHIISSTGYRWESWFLDGGTHAFPEGTGMDFQGYVIDSITLEIAGFDTYWEQAFYYENNYQKALARYVMDHEGSALLTWSVNGSPTPIPGAVWLLGSGLVGLVGLRRRFGK